MTPTPTRLAILALTLLAMLAALLPLSPAASAQSSGQLGVTLTAQYSGTGEPPEEAPIQTGVAAGAVSTVAGTGTFTFEASCALGCVDSTVQTRWDFGDDTPPVVVSGGRTSHSYTTPGQYTVSVLLSGSPTDPPGATASSGQARMVVLVGPRYADTEQPVPADPADPNSQPIPNPVREIARAIGALGLLSSCRTASASEVKQYFEKFSDGTEPSGTQGNQQLFCPEPNRYYGPVNPDAPTPAPSVGSRVNGLTGENCFAHWEHCGLPARVFAQANAGDPRGSCNTVCLTQLETLGLIRLTRPTEANPAERYDLTYSPTNCLDGRKAELREGRWVLTTGTEFGCVSRREFFTALTTALDGYAAGDRGLYRLPNFCGTGTSVPAIERAGALGIPAKRSRDGGQFCDPEQAVTKADAYRALQVVTGSPVDTDECRITETLRDLQDPTLADRPDSEDDRCVPIGGLIAAGAPIVGSTTCPDGDRVCFNPDEALTRAQLAQLLVSQLSAAGTFGAASGVTLAVTPSKTSAKVGETVTLSAVVTVPVSFDPTNPGHTVTIKWPLPGEGGKFLCDSTQTQRVSVSRRVEFTCGYTQSTKGTASMQVNASATTGTVTLGAAPQTVRVSFGNEDPVLGSENMPMDTAEDTPAEQQISGADADSTDLTYTVAATETGTYAASAAISHGTVDVVRTVAGQGVVVRMTPTLDRNGEYSFWLRVQDNLGGESRREVRGRILARNDEPVVRIFDTTTPRTLPAQVQLEGNDLRDSDQPGYPPCGPLKVFTFTAVPDGAALGQLEYNPGNGYVPVTQGLEIPADGSPPDVRFVPSGNAAGTYQFSYTATDVGYRQNSDGSAPTTCGVDNPPQGDVLTSDAQPVTIQVT